MKNRIDKILETLHSKNQPMLSPYITAGDPDTKTTLQLLNALSEAGADVLELGIPFSDPMAEGPIIQGAMERALDNGVFVEETLELVKQFREKNQSTAIVLMGYVNPIEIYGYESFAKDASKAGVDGLILVDMPPEESEDTQGIWEEHNIHRIFLCSPTTTADRMKAMNQFGNGYLYYVSLKGVTGSSAIDVESVKKDYQLRKSQTDIPLMVGFGIKTPETAAKIAEFADGVIVGAALVDAVFNALENNLSPIDAARHLIGNMRQSMNSKI